MAHDTDVDTVDDARQQALEREVAALRTALQMTETLAKTALELVDKLEKRP